MTPPRRPGAPALPYRARRALSILILVVGVPLYVAAAVTVVALFERPPIWAELLVYVALGLLWALPFRAVFLGVGKADPDAPQPEEAEPPRRARRQPPGAG